MFQKFAWWSHFEENYGGRLLIVASRFQMLLDALKLLLTLRYRHLEKVCLVDSGLLMAPLAS